ncbi:MAG: hypothetical protein JWO11_3059 [Nocardioides sp.]|nr:hypothetical protein [Nocardioides sp.]
MKSLRVVTPLLLSPLLLLTGCGGDESTRATPSTAGPTASSTADSASPSPSASSSATTSPGNDLPDCAKVWVADNTLPRHYTGCSSNGEVVKADRRYCEFGKPLITFDDRFYAVPEGPVNASKGPLDKDPGYRSALASCMA